MAGRLCPVLGQANDAAVGPLGVPVVVGIHLSTAIADILPEVTTHMSVVLPDTVTGVVVVRPADRFRPEGEMALHMAIVLGDLNALSSDQEVHELSTADPHVNGLLMPGGIGRRAVVVSIVGGVGVGYDRGQQGK